MVGGMVTVAFGEPGSVEDVMFAGHVMVGGSVSVWISSTLVISSKHISHSQISFNAHAQHNNTWNRLP